MNAPDVPQLEYPHATPPAFGAVVDVAPNIRWLRMPLPFALDHINLWLVSDGHERVAVDCGFGDAATRALWETHFTHTLDGAPLTRVVVTHYHPDHLGNARWLSDRFGVGVAMTLGEFLTANACASMAGDGAGPLPLDLFRAHGMAADDRAALLALGNGYRRGVPELPARFDRLLAGDRITLAGVAFTVLAGYGHSPEHAALHAVERDVLIAGDMLLPRISTNVSITATDPDGDPLGRFLDSLSAFERLPASTLVLPSHGLPFRGAALRVAQLRAHHAQRLAELEHHLRTLAAPIMAVDVLQLLFRRELNLQQLTFAMGEAVAHLNYLWLRGRLVRNAGRDGHITFRTAA